MKLGSENLFVILFEHTWQRHGTVSAFGHYPQPKPIISHFNNQWSSLVLFVYNVTIHQITHITVLPLRRIFSSMLQSSPIYLSNGASLSNNWMGREVLGPGGIWGRVQGLGSDHWGTRSLPSLAHHPRAARSRAKRAF